jgi:predicted PurR-regulated permease PerM
MKAMLLKINQALLLPILVTVLLYFGKLVLIPLCFAILLAMLMAPVCRFLDGKGCGRAVSCTVCVLILLMAMLLLLAIVAMQIADLWKDAEQINQKLQEIGSALKQQVSAWFSITPEQQDAIMEKQAQKMKKTSSFRLDRVVTQVAGILGGIAIVLVITFLLLFHKEKYQHFFLKLYPVKEHEHITKVLDNITHVAQQYLAGRIMSMIFLFVLYAIALLIIGIKNALLLSAIASLLTIIPYAGPILGGLLPFITAIVTEDSTTPALWVLAALLVIQAIDNYFVEPNVIGGEVRLTALVTILSIVIGGILWGVAGMILFIPLVSIMKIIFDNVEKLKPYGYLIGDQGKSPGSKLKQWLGKKKG